MAIGLPNLRNLVFNKESMGDLGSLGIDLSNLPTIDPGTVTKMPATTTTGAPGSAWWQDAGYPDAATAIQSGNFSYDMNTGWQLKPGAETPAMKLAAATTPEDTTSTTPEDTTTLDSGESPTSPGITSESIMQYLGEVGPLVEGMDVNGDGIVDNLDMQYQLQIEQGLRNPDGTINENYTKDETTAAVDKAVETALPATKQPVEKDLVRDDPVTAIEKAVNTAVETASGGQGIATGYSGDGYADTAEEEQSDNDVVKELIDSISVNNTSESDIDAAIAAAVAAAQGEGMTEIAAKEEVEKELASDPATKAVDAAVGNGQPTTDDTILDTATTDTTETTGTTGTDTGTDTQQPDFMTQLQELIAQMQGEQTAAAEAAAAAEAERQKQAAEMTQNYMVGQPAVGYNPYQSGQYQNNPYGAAGVPDMGGITSIPVPAAYTPNPYLIGGTT